VGVTGFSVVDTARTVGALQWALVRLSELFDEWVALSDDPQESVWLSTTSRHLRVHVQAVAHLLPDSELLADVAIAGAASPELVDALHSLGIIRSSAEGDGPSLLVRARALILQLADDCDAVTAHCALHSDGPLARVATALGAELGTDMIAADSVMDGLRVGSGGGRATPVISFVPDLKPTDESNP